MIFDFGKGGIFLGHDGDGDLLGGLFVVEEFDEGEAEVEGGAGASGGEEVAVEGDAFVGVVGELGGGGGVSGEVFIFQ